MAYGSRGSIGHVCPSIPLDMILNECDRMVPEDVMMVYSSLHVQQLRQQLEATQVQLAEVARLADQDALTPTSNRRAFVRELTPGHVSCRTVWRSLQRPEFRYQQLQRDQRYARASRR